MARLQPGMLWVIASLTFGVGALLGLFGGGGSVLLVPLLVYVAGVPARSAIAISLLVVGGTTAAASLMRGHRRFVRWETGLLFGVAGSISAYAGGRVAAFVPDALLLPGFSLVMIAAGAAMLRRKSQDACDAAPEQPRRARPLLAVGLGSSIGFMSGLAGAGGGFLVVPALVLFGGLDMGAAISTSLLVVASQSLAGFLGHTHDLRGYTAPAIAATGIAIAGSIIGSGFRATLSHTRLRRGFAAFVALAGVFMLAMQVPHSWIAGVHAYWTYLAPVLGGVVIGVAAAQLWLLNGRIAGVSGIAGGVLHADDGDRLWRALFVLGLVAGGLLVRHVVPSAFEAATVAPITIIVAGLLVGFGTALARGCTSGHGVCGVSRLAPRSLVAVAAFMSMGMLTASLVRHVLEVL